MTKEFKLFIVMTLLAAIAMLVPIHKVDPVIEPYIEEFKSIGQSVCKEVDYFSPPKTVIGLKKGVLTDKESIIGVCYRSNISFKIEYDEDYFYGLNPTSKKALVFHELTHCMLLIDHSEDRKNYMYENLVELDEKTLYNQVRDNFKRRCL